MIRAIVAVGEDWAIGKDDDIPWHVPADMKHFRRTTMGSVVVMGRRTFESMLGPLEGRTNVVLSRSRPEGEDDTGVIWIRDPERAVELAESLERDLYVAGGATVYRAYRDLIHEWLVTRIPETVPDADTHFDASLLEELTVVDTEELAPGLVVETYRDLRGGSAADEG